MNKGWPACIAILLGHVRKTLWNIVSVKIYSHFAVLPPLLSAVTHARARHQRGCPLPARAGEVGGSDRLLPARVLHLKSNPPGRPLPDACPVPRECRVGLYRNARPHVARGAGRSSTRQRTRY